MTPSLKQSWIVWASAAFFFSYQFILRVSPSVMSEELMAEFNVDACTLGTLASLYFYAYAPMQIPVGTLLDKFGPRRPLIFAAITCTAGIILFASSDVFFTASLGRFLMGFGSAFGFLSCMKVGALWFPGRNLSLIIGLTLFGGTVGAMTGTYPLSFMIDLLGWKSTMWIIAGGGIIIAGLLAAIIKDQPPKELDDYIQSHHGSDNPKLSIPEGFKEILGKPQTYILAFYGTMMYVPLTGFADMWGVPFLCKVHGLDKQSASLASSFFYFGIGVGTPLFGLLSDRIKRFKASLFTSSLGAFCLFFFIIHGSTPPQPILTGILFLTGVFLGGQFMCYSIVTEINPLSVSGMATGCQNMACLTSGIIFQPLIGWILDLFWDQTIIDGIRVYSCETFQISLSVILVCMALAFVASLFIREAYPKT